MATLKQLSLFGRFGKKRRCEVPALMCGPQRKAVVHKMGITSPRKPNSAKRKFAKVRIILAKSKKLYFAHIPGIGSSGLQEYSIVLVEGGNPPDVPGVNYSLIRGLFDFVKLEDISRSNRRSKFGVNNSLRLLRKGIVYGMDSKGNVITS